MMQSDGRNTLTTPARSLSPRGDMTPDGASPRVLLVTPQPFFEERGTPIAVAMVSRALVESGFDVEVLAFPIGSDPQIRGVKVRRCGNPFGFRNVRVGFSLRKALLDVSLLRSFDRLMASRRYALVHAVEEAAWLAAMVCPRRGVPFIYDMASSIPEQLVEHRVLGNAPAQRMLRGVERRVVERADHVVCSGGLGAHVKNISRRVPTTEWRFPILQETASPSQARRLRERHDIGRGDRVLLYTGNFSSYQGIDLLVEGFMHAAAADPQLLLVCVGASDQGQIEALKSKLPAALHARVRLLTRQPRSMMPAWYEAADCLVSLRTLGDNIPLKVFEYMATRRPIVASRGPAHEPLLNEGRAFLCDPDPDDVARTIHRVFADPVHARRVAETAAVHAERNFSWSRFRQLVSGVYARVLRDEAALEVAALRQH